MKYTRPYFSYHKYTIISAKSTFRVIVCTKRGIVFFLRLWHSNFVLSKIKQAHEE